jgi:hypothetical protein
MKRAFAILMLAALALASFAAPKAAKADDYLDIIEFTCTSVTFEVKDGFGGGEEPPAKVIPLNWGPEAKTANKRVGQSPALYIFIDLYTIPIETIEDLYTIGTHTVVFPAPLPEGTFVLIGYLDESEEFFTVLAAECANGEPEEFFSPCGFTFPVYGAAVARVGQNLPGLSEPGGEQAAAINGERIFLPFDSDGNGFDEMLIIDIDEGYYGLYVGGCDPVYVKQGDVQVTRLTDLGRLTLSNE